jgi:hypothetical protein
MPQVISKQVQASQRNIPLFSPEYDDLLSAFRPDIDTQLGEWRRIETSPYLHPVEIRSDEISWGKRKPEKLN